MIDVNGEQLGGVSADELRAKQGAALQGAANQGACGAATKGEYTLPPSPLRERLHGDAANLSDQLYRSTRALDILQRHPEFEEFIELLRLVRVGIRVKPVQAERALVLE